MINIKVETKHGDVLAMDLNVQGAENDVIYELAILLNELEKCGVKTFIACGSHISKTKKIDDFLHAFNSINAERTKFEK